MNDWYGVYGPDGRLLRVEPSAETAARELDRYGFGDRPGWVALVTITPRRRIAPTPPEKSRPGGTG